ncbi:MAG: PorV/PorQ family protein [bacterium]
MLSIAPRLSYAGSAGTSSMTFLKIPQGSRPAGMGEVFSAISDDPMAVYWNPAGLSFIRVPELSAQFYSYVEDTTVQNIVYSMPLPIEQRISIGAGLMLLQSNDFKKTVVSDNTYGFEETGSFDSQDLSLNLGSGVYFTPQASIGINLKFIQETIDTKKATAVAGDIGLILQSVDRPYRLGLLAQHIGTQAAFNKESWALPRTYRFSIARKILSSGWIGFEAVKSADYDLEFKAGAEIPVGSFFAGRLGYKHPLNKAELGDYTGMTAGLGFIFPYYELDYAIASFGDFGYTHRISMNFTFGLDGESREIY